MRGLISQYEGCKPLLRHSLDFSIAALDISFLSHIFQLPETITHPKACRVSSCEAILLCLYRLTTGNTWLVAEQVFELPAQYLALVFRETMAELWSSIKDVFRGLRHTAWLTQETLQLYANLTASLGVAGLNVCGFVDGTLLKTARPTM